MEITLDDKYSNKRYKFYGTCQTCNRCNTDYSWCQSCEPKLLTQGWTSSNDTLDEIIKSTQLKATGYDNMYYLQWITYEDLKDVEKIGEGGFATIYKATWINGEKYTNCKNNYERSTKDKIVALKKLHGSQNISEEFLNEVNGFFFFFLKKKKKFFFFFNFFFFFFFFFKIFFY